MKGAAIRSIATTVAERALGQQPGRTRAVTAAMIAGVATAAVTYKLLRSGGDDDDDDE
ncbi:MAG: hypothetical protein JO304_06665 [Solirubrobacterales bacterium]|nr:hypothetical protein [Solirubrobacterales bacterium]